MKRNTLKFTFFLLMLMGSLSSCKKEDNYSYDFFYLANGEKEYLKIREDRVILKAKSETEARTLSKETIFISAYIVGYDLVIATINPQKIKLDNLLQRTDVVSATYGLEYKDGTLQYPTDRIFVKLKEGKTQEEVFDYIGLTKDIEAIELFNPYSEIYKITLNVKLGDILRICRNLFESGLFEFAEPSFIRIIETRTVTN